MKWDVSIFTMKWEKQVADKCIECGPGCINKTKYTNWEQNEKNICIYKYDCMSDWVSLETKWERIHIR